MQMSAESVFELGITNLRGLCGCGKGDMVSQIQVSS